MENFTYTLQTNANQAGLHNKVSSSMQKKTVKILQGFCKQLALPQITPTPNPAAKKSHKPNKSTPILIFPEHKRSLSSNIRKRLGVVMIASKLSPYKKDEIM